MICVIFIIAPPTFILSLQMAHPNRKSLMFIILPCTFIILPCTFIIEPLTFIVTFNNRVVTLRMDQSALFDISQRDFVPQANTSGILESAYKANPMAGINRPGDSVIRHHSSITAQTDQLYGICFKWFQYRPNGCELTVPCQGFSTTQGNIRIAVSLSSDAMSLYPLVNVCQP